MPSHKLVLVGVVLVGLAGVARAGDVAADAAHELDLGDAALQQGQYDVALAHFNAARLLAPDRPAPYRYLGQTYGLMGKCPEAVDALEQYLKYMKKQPNAEAMATLERCKAILQREADEKRARDQEVDQQRRQREAAAQESERQRQAEEQRRNEELRQQRELQASEQRRLQRIADAQAQEQAQIDNLIKSQRVGICDPATNPNAPWKGDVFWFCTQAEGITENEFLRRYERDTGSHEAHYAIKLRNKGYLVATLIGAVAGAVMMGYGFANLNRPCDPTSSSDMADPSCMTNGMFSASNTTLNLTPFVVGVIGLGVFIATAAVLLPPAVKQDGIPVEHVLSRFECERLARQYNGTLERKARQQLGLGAMRFQEPPRPRVEVTPIFGGSSLGVVGRF